MQIKRYKITYDYDYDPDHMDALCSMQIQPGPRESKVGLTGALKGLTEPYNAKVHNFPILHC